MTFENFQEAIRVYHQLLDNQRILVAVMGRQTLFVSKAIHLDDVGKEEAIVVLGSQQERLAERMRELGVDLDLNRLLKERESAMEPS